MRAGGKVGGNFSPFKDFHIMVSLLPPTTCTCAHTIHHRGGWQRWTPHNRNSGTSFASWRTTELTTEQWQRTHSEDYLWLENFKLSLPPLPVDTLRWYQCYTVILCHSHNFLRHSGRGRMCYGITLRLHPLQDQKELSTIFGVHVQLLCPYWGEHCNIHCTCTHSGTVYHHHSHVHVHLQ